MKSKIRWGQKRRFHEKNPLILLSSFFSEVSLQKFPFRPRHSSSWYVRTKKVSHDPWDSCWVLVAPFVLRYPLCVFIVDEDAELMRRLKKVLHHCSLKQMIISESHSLWVLCNVCEQMFTHVKIHDFSTQILCLIIMKTAKRWWSFHAWESLEWKKERSSLLMILLLICILFERCFFTNNKNIEFLMCVWVDAFLVSHLKMITSLFRMLYLVE